MQGRAARKIELFYQRADPSMAQVFEKMAAGTPEALSDFELVQLFSDAAANFTSYEETWLEAQEGLQPKATQDVVKRSLAIVFSIPGFRAAWPPLRITTDPEFVAVADRILLETTSGGFALPAAYRQALVAELAKVG
jgi:hypothetical protein